MMKQQIFDWLKEIDLNWYKEDDKIFRSNKLEIIHAYIDKIKYWEDLRTGQEGFQEFTIPLNREQLNKFLYGYRTSHEESVR